MLNLNVWLYWGKERYENVSSQIEIQSSQFYACPVAGPLSCQEQVSFHCKNWCIETEVFLKKKKEILKKYLAFGKQEEPRHPTLPMSRSDQISPKST